MSTADWVIVVLAAAIVLVSLALAWYRRRHGKTGCGGGCSGCPHAGSCDRSDNSPSE